jgi:hypothetical protein
VKANIVKINQSEKETSEKRRKPRNSRLIWYRETSGRWPVIDETQETYMSATSSTLEKLRSYGTDYRLPAVGIARQQGS